MKEDLIMIWLFAGLFTIGAPIGIPFMALSVLREKEFPLWAKILLFVLSPILYIIGLVYIWLLPVLAIVDPLFTPMIDAVKKKLSKYGF